jgi:hypothetical protein
VQAHARKSSVDPSTDRGAKDNPKIRQRFGSSLRDAGLFYLFKTGDLSILL